MVLLPWNTAFENYRESNALISGNRLKLLNENPLHRLPVLRPGLQKPGRWPTVLKTHSQDIPEEALQELSASLKGSSLCGDSGVGGE